MPGEATMGEDSGRDGVGSGRNRLFLASEGDEEEKDGRVDLTTVVSAGSYSVSLKPPHPLSLLGHITKLGGVCLRRPIDGPRAYAEAHGLRGS